MKELLIVFLVCLVIAAILWSNRRLRENIQNIFKIEELRKNLEEPRMIRSGRSG